MQGGGLIIRLIDVVMIILLGFLNISEFGIKAQIKLDSANSEVQQNETRMYFVMVSPGGGFVVTNNLDEQKIMFSGTEAEVNSGSQTETDAEGIDENLVKLERFLVKKFRENKQKSLETLVVIQSHPETKIQYAINVLDICEKNQIPRTISY